MIRVNSEQELLDEKIRAGIIESLESEPNLRRKAEAFKAYECLKDKTIHYVLDLLLKQFDEATVYEMQYAMSNISFFRKVIGKLARVYANGVKRTMPAEEGKEEKPVETEEPVDTEEGSDPEAETKPEKPDPKKVKAESQTQVIEKFAEILKMTPAMKKTNRYHRAFLNTLVFTRPVKQEDDKFSIKIEALAPYHYDVVEDPNDPEKALAVILSDYCPDRKSLYSIGNAAAAGRTGKEAENGYGNLRQSSGDKIAAKLLAGDAGKENRIYTWWSKNHHFKTNAKGVIIPNANAAEGEAQGVNPIAALPFTNFVNDQDGQFWAEGGSDLVDEGIKINALITNTIHVAVTQGHGQLWMSGENLPKTVKVGVNHCVQMEWKKDENAEPKVGYLSSNPQIMELKALIEMYVALMLTTNNLSTSAFATDLQSGTNFASGIALMIDKAESIEDVNEQAEIYRTGEPKVWGIVGKWHEVYGSRKLLIEDLQSLTMPKEIERIQVAFPPAMPILSEKEQLEIIKLRQDLGINTMVELLIRDNPSLTETEAEERLAKILEEKIKRAQDALAGGMPNPNDPEGGKPGKPGVKPNESQGQGSNGNANPDDDNAGNRPGSKRPGKAKAKD